MIIIFAMIRLIQKVLAHKEIKLKLKKLRGGKAEKKSVGCC